MCGIAGFTGLVNKALLSAMTRQIIHRGPDDEGFYYDNHINLGMRRLSIIDLKTGHQPIHNEDQTIWVTCNGEIYNFQELRANLEKQGHRFYTHSDTEVLVHLYEEYGADFLRHLNGMYAIAMWDSKRRRLLLARDRLGVKPLYYQVKGKNIFYASEIKCLVQNPEFERKISMEALSHFLTYRNVPAPLTIYETVFSLLPGECLAFEDGKVTKWKYWRVDFSKQEKISENEALDRITDLLRDAVKLRMISDVPVGAYLSGGVDSSLVVALMMQMAGQPIKTFSLAYEEELDYKKDSYYAKMISERFGTEHYEYVMKASELPENLEKIVWHLDQPFAGVISTFFLSQLVQQHVKVALTGDGADDQFGSYAHHRLCWPIENYVRARRANLEESAVDFRPYVGQEDYVKRIAEDDLADWRIKFYALTDADKELILSRQALEQTQSFSSLELLRKNLDASSNLDSLNRLLDVDVNTLLPDEILVFADRLSMAHSLELRSPFLDYRFVEMVAKMPGSLKIKNGIPKYILKKVAEKFLPKEVIYRQKEGFILPQDSWMRGCMKDYVSELLSEEHLKLHGFFKSAGVKELLQGYLEKKHSNSYKIWNLVMFQMWYEKVFLRGRG